VRLLLELLAQPSQRGRDVVDRLHRHGVPVELWTVIREVSNPAICRVLIAIVALPVGLADVPILVRVTSSTPGTVNACAPMLDAPASLPVGCDCPKLAIACWTSASPLLG